MGPHHTSTVQNNQPYPLMYLATNIDGLNLGTGSSTTFTSGLNSPNLHVTNVVREGGANVGFKGVDAATQKATLGTIFVDTNHALGTLGSDSYNSRINGMSDTLRALMGQKLI